MACYNNSMTNKQIKLGLLALIFTIFTASFASAQSTQSAKVQTNIKVGDTSITTETTSETGISDSVQELLKAADREKGIGAEVRVIAQEQQESNEKIEEAKVKVESRSKIKTLLFGTDYKNVGVIRSEMVKTESQISKLERLAEKATTTEATLNAQIDALKAAQLKIQAFIDLHLSSFSLFGWLANKD